jgi:hypothetical protein
VLEGNTKRVNSGQEVRKDCGKKQEAGDFSSIRNYKMKMVLKEKGEKTNIISKLIANVYMITILVSKSLETVRIMSKQSFR